MSRQLVHKTAAGEVLLICSERRGADAFSVTAQWPRAHCFYDVVAGRHDPLLVAETARQCIPLLSHLGYGAPADHRQIWKNLTWSVEPEALLAASAPAEIRLDVQCQDVVRRGDRLAALSMSVILWRDGAILGSATTRFTNHSPSVIARLRGPYHTALSSALPATGLPVPLPAERVGRDRPRDVVLSPGKAPHTFGLRVDGRHPVLFDHATDHVPGMLLVEAARQATQAVAFPDAALITGMAIKYHRYVELDRPCLIEAEVLPAQVPTHVSTRVTAVQDEEAAFTALVTAQRAPALGPPAHSY
ncbi:ScbA/BarX family gamma-butyrolactone biosynthesis protein [Streptomyces sp. SID6139]|uniref:ScbA/BarX family gamma-butyrolactone biosynthesis protein n=1 Tax=Streptomyces sp. SID6139 TaxID=2690320 RepID=UPI001369C974|nr:transcriptional regulator [Streptomyces sp. SID6139]MYR04812.1 transcriptional regulator [Streptomyces sp. SID6139]MYR17589.1 transcriptional regulator [Streptomyces sp. SID6137]